MNRKEREMLDILLRLREGGCVAVKAEFEAEGTRVEELLRLLEIARRAGLGIGLKIGGCEAVRDLIEAKQFGVDYIIAPMVESAYALEKYVLAKNRVFTEEEQEGTHFLFNVETRLAFDHLDSLLKQATVPGGVDGVVFGRVDYCGSMAKSRDAINEGSVTRDVVAAALACKAHGLQFVVGGGVSIDALPSLREVEKVHLTRFETRKVIFESAALKAAEMEKNLLLCVRFELLWLLNKSDYYGFIQAEDQKRIEMLNSRWQVLDQ